MFSKRASAPRTSLRHTATVKCAVSVLEAVDRVVGEGAAQTARAGDEAMAGLPRGRAVGDIGGSGPWWRQIGPDLRADLRVMGSTRAAERR